MQPGTSISTSYASQNNHPNVAVRTLIDKEKARINPPQLPPQSPLVTIGDDLGAVMQRQPAVQPKGEPVVRLPPAFFGATQAVLQSWFTVFDTDRDGRINTMQLQQALEAGGLTFSLKTVSSIMPSAATATLLSMLAADCSAPRVVWLCPSMCPATTC